MSHLVLGWQVTGSGDPRYWLEPRAQAGKEARHYLARTAAETMANHTIVIAQSGAGKSFFLGRLLEELIIRTKARCIVLDPNGDLRKLHEVQSAELWTQAKFDPRRRVGKLPHESSREKFLERWDPITKSILTRL
jgi:Helicase HerA, central domain